MFNRLICSFAISGQAQPAGSKSSFVPLDRKTKQPFRRPNGGVVVSTVDSNPKSKDWKHQVADAAARAMQVAKEPGAIDGPLRVVMCFQTLRPKGHFGSGRNSAVLKESSPPFPATKPDVLKLARAVEDGMKGVVYRDDCQIVSETIEKVYGSMARCSVEVWAL